MEILNFELQGRTWLLPVVNDDLSSTSTMDFPNESIRIAFELADDTNEMMMLQANTFFNESREMRILLAPLLCDDGQLRIPKWRHNRLNWNEHVQKLQHEGTFNRMYRMSLESFNKLVDLLREEITVDFAKSSNSTRGNEPIFPELVVAAGLLAHGMNCNHLLVKEVVGCSKSSIDRVVEMFRLAVLGCSELDIKLPTTEQELQAAADGFDRKSYAQGIFYGVVGAIDRRCRNQCFPLGLVWPPLNRS